MVPQVGAAPTAFALSRRCSTVELLRELLQKNHLTVIVM